MSTTPVAPASSQASLSQALAGNRQLGQQEFLKLLVTQLTNQDPLSPQDDKEFLAQMAQFSTVEGITNMGTEMSRAQAAGLIGKTVDAVSPDGSAASGIVTAVKFQSDGPHLVVNGADVTMDQIQQIRDK